MYTNPAKQKAWESFAKFIRLRDSVATTGTLDWCRCISCGHKTHSVLIDAGHCIRGRHNAILFDERATNGQCQYCNRTLGGNYPAYELAIDAKYGEGVMAELKAKNQTTVKYSKLDFLEIMELYEYKYDKIYNSYKKL